ncbi:MAG: M48 family metalloprotease [Candidatus Aenigmarchaeota archaeon]|nr:M48 family metalloprotease [Candidatus Aenigmarchaeota archaeon]
MAEACLYCLGEIAEVVSCTATCLANSNIPPAYPGSILFGSASFSAIFFFLAFHFRNNVKRLIGFRLAGIAFLSTAIFTLGLIFSGHLILKNLPMIIPAIGIGSFSVSYLLSFYLVKLSYKPMLFENKTFRKFLARFSKELNIKLPSLYVFISKEPKAFVVDGFKKAIFISDSIIERLGTNSIKAVLLHELYHLKRGTGVLKNIINSISNLNFKIIPVPIKELERYEEEEIDRILLIKHGINIGKIKKCLWET